MSLHSNDNGLTTASQSLEDSWYPSTLQTYTFSKCSNISLETTCIEYLAKTALHGNCICTYLNLCKSSVEKRCTNC